MDYSQNVEVEISTPVQKITGSAPCNKDKMKNKLPSGPLSALSICLPKIYISVRREKGHNKEAM